MVQFCLMEKGRIPELDGIRGLAILLVVIFHYFVLEIDTTPGTILAYLQMVFLNSNSGVDLFFVLSGFLIGGILLDHRDAPNYFKVFYARRFYRIFPLYYLALALFYIAYALGAQRLENPDYQIFSGPLPFWTYLLYVQNFAVAILASFGCYGLGATWSLAIEEQFYLIAPLAVRKLSSRSLGIVLIVVIVTAYGFRLLLSGYPEWETPVYVLTFCRADTLALGMLTALMVRRVPLQPAPLYLLWAALALVAYSMSKRHITNVSIEMIYYGYTAFAAFYAVTILLVVSHTTGFLASVFRFRPLRELGTLAYCIYLVHAPANGLMHALVLNRTPHLNDWRDAGVTLLAFAITVVIARLSWVYFERPLLKIGQRHVYTDNPLPITVQLTPL